MGAESVIHHVLHFRHPRKALPGPNLENARTLTTEGQQSVWHDLFAKVEQTHLITKSTTLYLEHDHIWNRKVEEKIDLSRFSLNRENEH